MKCDNGHDPIEFESYNCPVCELQFELASIKRKDRNYDKVQAEIVKLRAENKELSKVRDLRDKLMKIIDEIRATAGEHNAESKNTVQ